MSEDITGSGLTVNIIATGTFPAGFDVTQFPDDTDPLDVPELQTAEVAMGLNGDLISWSTPKPVLVDIAVIPDSEDDLNLGILFEANRTGKGKRSVADKITFSRSFPGENPLIATNGKIIAGNPFSGVSSDGRKKTKIYRFAFENKVGV